MNNSIHPHLKWWLDHDNVLYGQPLHPLDHLIQIFTDTSKEECAGSYRKSHDQRSVVCFGDQASYKSTELKAVLALRQFSSLVSGKIVLIATDHTTVVSFINKEGGMWSWPFVPC